MIFTARQVAKGDNGCQISPWEALGPKTESNLKLFLGNPFDMTMTSPFLVDSTSIPIDTPASISSKFRGRHLQKTLMFPEGKNDHCVVRLPL